MQNQKDYMSEVVYVQENIPLLCQRLRMSTGMIQASLTLLQDTANKLEQCLEHLANIRSQLTTRPPDYLDMQPTDVSFTRASLEQNGTTQPTTKPRNGRRARRDRHSVDTSETSNQPAAKDARTKARSTKVKSSRHSS